MLQSVVDRSIHSVKAAAASEETDPDAGQRREAGPRQSSPHQGLAGAL